MECNYYLNFITTDGREILLIEAHIVDFNEMIGTEQVGLGSRIIEDSNLVASLKPLLNEAKHRAIHDARNNDPSKGTARLLQELVYEVI